MALVTTTDIAGPVNVVFQQTLLRRAKSLCVYFAGSTPASIAEHSGTFTAKWRRFDSLAAVTMPLTELSGAVTFPTRTSVSPTLTDLTATVQKYGNFMFLNEEVDLLNFSQQGDELMDILGTNAGQSLNRKQRDVLEDNLTQIFSGSATTATGINAGSTASGQVKRTEVQNVVNTLQKNEAMKFTAMTTGSQNIGTTPIRPSYYAFTHTDVEEDLRVAAGFTSAELYAGQTALLPGEIGTMGGIRFIATPEATIDFGTGWASTGSATINGRAATAGRADVYNTVVIGQDCHGSVGFGFEHIREIYRMGDNLPGVQVITKPRGSAGAADPLNEVSSIGWKSWHAGLVLNTSWGRVLRSVAMNLQQGVP